MRPKSMVLILIALGCGLIASIGISQVVERNAGGDKNEVQTQPIFVAMSDMSIGEELNANSVKLEEWPIDKIPEGAVTDASQIEGMSPNQRMFAGEPLLLGKLVDANLAASSSKKIKKGYRVASVKVDMASSVSYLIHPGDHVDVMAFAGSGGRSQAEVILSNIEVFAINSQTEQKIDNETGRSTQAKTVSLLVTPSQTLKLMASSYQGRISLSLRRPDDEEDNGAGDDENIDEAPIAAPIQPQMPFFDDSGFDDEPKGPGFIMEVMEGGSSESVRRYTWDGSSDLPREMDAEGGMGSDSDFDDEVSDDFPFPGNPPGGGEEGDEAEAAEGSGSSNAPSRDGRSFQFN